MSAAPAVSVIIPTFNRARLLTAAIDSVRAQSFTDFEVIVVDDGSTDGTEALARGFDDPVRFVRTEHGGVAHARNVGVRHARGRYLAFLDSDDLFYPYTLDLLVRLLQRFPEAAFVCAEMSGFDDHGFVERYHLKRYHRSAFRHPGLTYDRIYASVRPLASAIAIPASLRHEDPAAGERGVYLGNVFDTYLLNLVICQNSVLLRREIADQAGDRNVGVRHWQEVDYLLRITRHHVICFVDVPTYRLRYHEDQESATSGPDGTYRWMRKQRGLLRVVRRHAESDTTYYASRRAAIERHLAHLHRAVAVPLLLLRGRRLYARAARLYLVRCAKYGRPARLLQLLAVLPHPVRGLGVQAVEAGRALFWQLMERLATRGTRRLALWLVGKAVA